LFSISIVWARDDTQLQNEFLNTNPPLNFEPFLFFENYSDYQTPQGFYFNSSQPKSLVGEFFGIEVLQFDSWDKPKQYMMRAESWGYLSVKVNPLLDGKLIAEGEMAYSPTEDFDPLLGFREYKNQMARFTIRGKWSKFEYGIKYLYVNDGFDEEPVTRLEGDKEGMEMWLNRSFGVFSIKTFYKDHWNNVDFVPKRERRKITEGGAALDIALPSWPIISLSYSRGTSLTIKRLDGADPELESIQTLSAYIYYAWSSRWKVTLASFYIMNKDNHKPGVTGSYFYSEISTTYSPTNSISIIPSLGFTREEYKYPGGGGGSNSPSASLSFSYSHPSKNFGLTAYGGYESQIDYVGLIEEQDVEGKAKLFWKMGETALGIHTLAIEFGYGHSDSIYEGASAVFAYRISTN